MNAQGLVLTVYLRRYCHLCHDLLAQLAPHGFQVIEVDIDLDPQLEARYGALIPVLTGADDEEICHYFLDEAALTAYLSKFR
ncbi:glutaredoxin family protein [Sulfuriferula sp.]|uniref:glutaredoxin family protein n=1 Tax=Sulfuriferula sp. TaxID=2025307 RepID=UPI002731646F|nr:glutaredoxin family protein [Sulfuriferula sp.]MDP2025488.1 glutaredoxin family protein [Sulfuriferula sp.]